MGQSKSRPVIGRSTKLEGPAAQEASSDGPQANHAGTLPSIRVTKSSALIEASYLLTL